MPKVKIERPLYVDGVIHDAGATVELTQEQIKALTDAGALGGTNAETKKVEAAPENKTDKPKA